ncbi:hypothetical protein DRQ36_03125 [bacterium]|nr:MAG: hypothetical protein DRQ36_03125 [bacterium]
MKVFGYIILTIMVTVCGFAQTDEGQLREPESSGTSLFPPGGPYSSDTVEIVRERPRSRLGEYGGVELIDAEDLRAMPTASLKEIIDNVTSAHIADHGIGQFPSVFLYGLGSSRSAVLLDGEQLLFPQLGLFDMNCFPREAVASAELITGGASALYGSEALGGAFDIVLQDEPPAFDYTKISGNWGSFDRRNLYALMNKRVTDRIGFTVTASELKGDLHRDAGAIWNQDFSATGYGGAGDFDLRVFGSRHDSDNDILNPVDSAGFSYGPGRQKDEARILNGRLSYRLHNTKIIAAFMHQDYQQRYWYVPENEDDFCEHIANSDGGKLSAKFDNTAIGSWEAGVSMCSYALESTQSGHNALTEYSGTVAGEYILPLKIRILAALRLDRDIREEIDLSPMFAIKAPISGDIECFGSFRIGYNSPSVNDLYWYELLIYPFSYPIDESTWVFDTSYTMNAGDPDLKTEKSVGGEFGIMQNPLKGLRYNIKGFYSKTENMIEWLYTWMPDTSVCSPVNFTEATIYGLNADFEFNQDEDFSFGGRYTYTHSESKTEQSDTIKPLPKMPEHRADIFAQETRYFLDDELSAFLRLETTAVFGIPNSTRNSELDPVILMRARLRLKFLTFSIFGMYEYALTKTDEGWKNEPYSLDPGFGPKDPGYLLPEYQWRLGAEWEFYD